MPQYQRDHNKSTLAHPFVVFVSVALALLLFVSVINMIGKKREAQEALVDYRQEATHLEQQKAEIQVSLNDLTTNKGREREIRERFPVVEEGEELIVIVEEDSLPDEQQNVDNVNKKKGFWSLFGF